MCFSGYLRATHALRLHKQLLTQSDSIGHSTTDGVFPSRSVIGSKLGAADMKTAILKPLVLFLSVAMLHLTGCALGSTSSADGELAQLSEFDRYYFKEFDPSSASDLEKLISLYDRTVAPIIRSDDLDQLDTLELKPLFDSANTAFSLNERRDILEDMESIVASLDVHDAADNRILKQMYVAFVRSGQADAANRIVHELREKHAADSPDEVGPLSAGVKLVLRDRGDPMLRPEPVDFQDGRHIVVLAHPLCGFSQRAVALLEATPEFSRLFEDDVLWTTHPSAVSQMDVIREWNARHPQSSIAPATSTSPWTEFESGWGTPTIYFFENGQLRHSVVGFNEHFVPELRKALSTSRD